MGTMLAFVCWVALSNGAITCDDRVQTQADALALYQRSLSSHVGLSVPFIVSTDADNYVVPALTARRTSTNIGVKHGPQTGR